jgi:hypothetical protein
MNAKTNLIALLAANALVTSSALASVITHDFKVEASTGPLAGQSATGWFSYDTRIVPARLPGGNLDVGLFTALSFTWNGVRYDEIAANTGSLLFDAAGNLESAIFGSNCYSGGCGVGSFREQWLVSTSNSAFVYATPNSVFSTGVSSFQIRQNALPEPNGAALLLIALSALLWRSPSLSNQAQTSATRKLIR